MDENQIALHIVTSLIVMPFLLKRWISIQRSIMLFLGVYSLAFILLLIVGALSGFGVSIIGVSIESLSTWFFGVLKGAALGYCLSFLLRSNDDQLSAINKSSKKEAQNSRTYY